MEQRLFELLHQCTVRISVPGKTGHGTGFFVAPGLILTCTHVIKAAQPIISSAEMFWKGQSYPVQIMKLQEELDLALLQANLTDHPCAYLNEEVIPFDALYSYGYPDDHINGDPATFTLEGKAGTQGEQLKFKTGQVRPGLSGAPLLNVRTGYVCGIVQLTRDRNNDLGGRAIPTTTVLRVFPELILKQQHYHLNDQRWANCLELEQIEGGSVGHLVTGSFDARFTLVEHRQPTRHDCYAHISFPPNYVVRMDVLSSVREALLADEPAVALTSAVQYSKPQALHGMGGIGKSVIARALCDDMSVQTAFPDGILWATLGQTPSLVAAMRLWVNALGGIVNENAPTVDTLKVTLAELLMDRACLLILDDVWQRSHADAFRVGGTRCHMLLTTRDAEIAYEIGAKVQSIPVMSESEAITLLEEWAAGSLSGADLKLEKQIVKRLGYLPLAIKLAGAQLRRKLPDEWLRTFDVLKLKSPRPEDIHDSLERTFRLSLDSLDRETCRLYVSLAIFKEEEATFQAGIERLWHGLGNLEAESTRDLLDDLAARALLEVASYQFSRVVRIHDLLRDLIRAELKDGRVAAHRALLRSYRAFYHAKGWHTVADDGYLYNHLAYHLHAAGAVEELKELFIDQNWLDVRVPQRDDTYDGYLEDLSLAWECVKTETREQIKANQEPTSFIECLRYALIRTSINSIAENYVPELVARAVEVGAWTPHRAMSIVGKVPDVTKQAKMYTAVLGTAKLSREQQEEAQQLGLEAALLVPDVEERVEALATLAPYLTEKLLERALERGLEAALEIEYEDELARALVALAPHLTGGLLEQALETALAMEDEQEGAKVLAVLEPKLRNELRIDVLERELEAILGLEDEEERVEVLEQAMGADLANEYEDERAQIRAALEVDISPEFEEERIELLELALEDDLSVEPEWEQASIFEPAMDDVLASRFERVGASRRAVVSQLTEEKRHQVLERVLNRALALKFDLERAWVLVALAPHLTNELHARALELALEVVLTLQSDWEQAKVLIALMPHLVGEQRVKALERGLDAALALKNKQEQVEAFTVLAPYLTSSLLELVFTHLEEMQEGEQADALVALAPHLRGNLLERGLEVALALQNEKERSAALLALAPHLTGVLHLKAVEPTLETALAQPDKDEREETLAALAPHLTKWQLEQVLKSAQALEYRWKRVKALIVLIPYLTGELHLQTVEQVLRVGLVLKDRWERVNVVADLAPQLNDELRIQALEQALATTLTLEYSRERLEALTTLSYHFTSKPLVKALEAALVLFDNYHRVKPLATLAPQLTRELLEQTLEIIVSMKYQEDREDGLAALAPHLTGRLLDRALEATLALENQEEIVEALAVLAPRLTGRLLEKGLVSALNLKPEKRRGKALVALAPYLTEKLREPALEAALELSTEEDRAMVLIALAPLLTGILLEHAFEAALALRFQTNRANVLIALPPQLTPEMLERAFGAALALWTEEERAKTLMALVPGLASELRGIALERALKAALELEDEEERAKTLVALVPQLTESMLEQVYEASQDFRDDIERAKTLMALVPRLVGELRDKALEQALEITLEFEDVEERWKNLMALVSQFVGSRHLEILESAFEADLELEDEEEPAQSVMAFLSYGLDQKSVERSTLQAMICTLLSFVDWSRWDVFRFLQFFIETLFIPQAFSSPILNTIASNVVEICEKWHWL